MDLERIADVVELSLADARDRRGMRPGRYDLTYKRRLAKWQAMVDEQKAGGCVLCGNTDLRFLEFHHRDPRQKSFNISASRSRPPRLVMAEIAKCDVLCANCHRAVHSTGSVESLLTMKTLIQKLWTEPAAFVGLLVSIGLAIGTIVTGGAWDWETIVAVTAPLLTSLGIRQVVTPAVKADSSE